METSIRLAMPAYLRGRNEVGPRRRGAVDGCEARTHGGRVSNEIPARRRPPHHAVHAVPATQALILLRPLTEVGLLKPYGSAQAGEPGDVLGIRGQTGEAEPGDGRVPRQLD